MAQNFDVLATSLKILHNYFDGLIKFRSIYLNFYFSKIVLSVYTRFYSWSLHCFI